MNFFTSEFKHEFVKAYEELINIPSPCGFTCRKNNYLIALFKKFNQKFFCTPSGRLYCYIPGQTSKTLLLLCHYDVLGLTLDFIKPNGRLAFQPEGDFLFESIENSICVVHSESGDYSGIIRSNESSLHIYKETARESKRSEKTMEIVLNHLDESQQPINSQKTVLELGISSADAISLDPNYQYFSNGLILSRGHDNQSGTHILNTIIKQLSKNIVVPYYNLLISYNNSEEKAYPVYIPDLTQFTPIKSIEDIDLAIAVDAILNIPDQELNETMTYICYKDKLLRYDQNLSKHLVKIAREKKMSHAKGYMKNFGTELSLGFLKGTDIISGMIGPVVDAVHSIERTHVNSLLSTLTVLWHLVTDKPYQNTERG